MFFCSVIEESGGVQKEWNAFEMELRFLIFLTKQIAQIWRMSASKWWVWDKENVHLEESNLPFNHSSVISSALRTSKVFFFFFYVYWSWNEFTEISVCLFVCICIYICLLVCICICLYLFICLFVYLHHFEFLC